MNLTNEQIANLKWRDGSRCLQLCDFILDHRLNDAQCVIGTDSQPYANFTRFVTSVCFRTGNNISFITRSFKKRHDSNFTVERRLMKEIEISIMIANYLTTAHSIEIIQIHADINPNPKYRSNRCMSAAKGFVEGMGYEYVGKPNSWAASSIADWFTK